jgi:hypothetical protein
MNDRGANEARAWAAVSTVTLAVAGVLIAGATV